MGEKIFISSGSSIYINGNYVNDQAAPSATTDPQLVLNGSLFASGDIINNSNVNILDAVSTGTIELNGNTTQQFSGSASFSLYRLTLNKTGNLQLLKSINVTNQITFSAGSINLNGYAIDLGNTGVLLNESNSNRIFGNGPGTVNYTLSVIPTLSDPLSNIGLRLEGVIFGGAKIKRGHAAQPNAGDGSINRYFDVELNGGDNIEKLRLYYLDGEIPGAINESNLVVYLSYDNGNVWQKAGGVVNTVSNFVEISGLSITSNIRVTLSAGLCAAPPIVDIGPPAVDFCSGSIVTLNAGNPGAFYQWSSGQTVQTIQASTAGVYTVTVRDARGCEGFDAITLTDRPVPVANFNSGIACPTQNVSFTNTSAIASGTLNYSWDFGDLSSTTDVSTAQHPQYAYPVDGNYDVRLIAKSDYNCVDTLRKTITVYPFPLVDFTFNNACFGLSTDFTNASTIAVGGMTYLWDFDDGTTSTVESPSKTFSTLSTYSVSLTATSNAGCIQTATKAVDIHHTPVANFAVTNSCESATVPISNASTIAAGTLSYNWNFGDATSFTDAVPVKSYLSSGQYTVVLTVTSDFNCVNTSSKPIDIYQNPIAAFSVTDDCKDKTFAFVNNSFSGQGSLSYLWDFDDGGASTVQTPSKVYGSDGMYNVALKVKTSFGCENTAVAPLTVFPLPVTNFLVDNTCQNISVPFINTTTINTGTAAFAWNFGDGTTATTSDPSKNYSASGVYTVTLTSTSDKGCITSRARALDIFALPVLDFGRAISTCGTSYTLDAENSGSAYAWSDGSSNQTLTVTQDGTYSVTVTNTNNCVVGEAVDIVLQGDVTPNLGVDQVVCGRVVLDAGYPGSSYAWSTGETSRRITVTATGNYVVTVTDPNNCVGTDEVAIVVNPVPVVALGSDRVVCADQQVILDAGNAGSSYQWSDNSTSRTLPILSSGTYAVAVTNSFGCIGRDTINVIVNPMPVSNFPATVNACDRLTLDATNAGASFLWSTGATNQQINIITSGTYSVTVTTQYNCVRQFTSNIIVTPSPLVNLGPDQRLCFGQSATLDAGSDGVLYKWSDGSVGKRLRVEKSGLYWVDVSSVSGCITRDSVEILIYPQIKNSLSPSYVLCKGENRTLDATSAQAVSYQWHSAVRGFVSSAPSIVVNTPEKLWIIMRDAINCSAVDTVRIETDPDPITARFLVATLVNVGDSVRFVQLSYPDPVQFNWNFADGIVSTKSDPTHIYLRPGDFDASLLVTDPNSCRDSRSKVITVRLLRVDGEELIAFPFVEIVRSQIYPNPSQDFVNVSLELNQQTEITMVLYSLQGKIIEIKRVSLKDDVVEFDVRHCSQGLYFIKVYVNNQIRTFRVLKM